MRFAGNHLRLAVVTEVDHATGVMRTQWLDNNAERGQNIPIPHPMPGRGEGIYWGIQPGTVVALAAAAYERYIPVAAIPMRAFYAEDLGSVSEVRFDDVGFPALESGEVAIQGVTGASIFFDAAGSLLVRNPFFEGLVLGGDPDHRRRCSILKAPPVEYEVSQAGLRAFGIIRRDIRPDDGEFDTAVADPLLDLEFENLLEEVGRDPTKGVALATALRDAKTSDASSTDQFRNPPFVEKREVLYEFGAEWRVDVQKEEEALLENGGRIPVRIPEDRRERRTNILSLSLAYPNELLETVEGTLVDLFGNLLDANRHVLPRPPDKKAVEWLRAALENAQHTVAFHKEINARKGWAYRESGLTNLPQDPDPKLAAKSSNNARDRSRWSVDVDKEGLTKINIPATSETGTVPVLARHENSSTVDVDSKGVAKKKGRKGDETKALYRPGTEEGKGLRDVFLDQVGPGGIAVVSRGGADGKGGEPVPPNRLSGEKTSHVDNGLSVSQATLPSTAQAGTAFHDITKTAARLLANSINKRAADSVATSPPSVTADDPAVHNQVNRVVPAKANVAVQRDAAGRPSNAPNAGGRSIQMSLDGSLETSIGANTIDRVSWMMDTAGGIVARIGRDRLGRSAVVQMDGTLAVEIGGFDFLGSSPGDSVDTRFVGGGTGRAVSLPKDQNIFKDGKVVIRVRRANAAKTGPDASEEDQLIIIDDTGISIEATGRLNLRSKGDLTLQSDARILLDGEVLQLYETPQKFVIKTDRKVV